MRIDYNGPVIVPAELLSLDLTNVERIVASALFTVSDLGGLHSTDQGLAKVLKCSTRGVYLAKKSLIARGIAKRVKGKVEFNFDAFRDPDSLKAVLVATAPARVVRPILATEEG